MQALKQGSDLELFGRFGGGIERHTDAQSATFNAGTEEILCSLGYPPSPRVVARTDFARAFFEGGLKLLMQNLSGGCLVGGKISALCGQPNWVRFLDEPLIYEFLYVAMNEDCGVVDVVG